MDKDKVFIPGVVPPTEQRGPALWFAFWEDKLLVCSQGSSLSIPHVADFEDLGLKATHQHYLGQHASCHCYAVELAEGITPGADMTFLGLRNLYGRVDEDLFCLAGRASQIVNWDRTHQFCGRCGTRLETSSTERAKECPQCGLLHFPRLAPAIIVLVERGHELLLARSRHFPSDMYSVLAGFVEPGETLEEAVVREVGEEVGLVIDNIRYFGSQPWPFPHSLMIGFTATYRSGRISLDDPEIEDAAWFTVDNLPTLPGEISISRRLIDWFLEKQKKTLKPNRAKVAS